MSKELREMLNAVQAKMKEEGVNYIVVTLSGTKSHKTECAISSQDEHHTLDMIVGLMKRWEEATHKRPTTGAKADLLAVARAHRG
jgi:hypothetical protein